MDSQQRIFILADDLTGSADAANYFRTQTKHVHIAFSERKPWDFTLDNSVVQVYDSETRACTEHYARESIYKVTSELLQHAGTPFYIYKKVDSTLRGNIGAEIEATLAGLGRRHAILVPTFPEAFRSVKNGILLVNGLPVFESDFAKDPRTPIHHSRIAELVSATTSLPIDEISLSIVRSGREKLQFTINNLPKRQSIVVVDAENSEDLKCIADTIANESDILPCGSAGLARLLAPIWNSQPSNSEEIRLAKHSPPTCDKVLVMVGSANPKAHEQLETLINTFKVPCITISPKHMNNMTNERIDINEKLKGSPVIALALANERAQTSEDLGDLFVAALAAIAKKWCEQQMQNKQQFGIIATGGDTAIALCKALATYAIWPQGEIEPGIPWSFIETPNCNMVLISKAGGFGDKEALQNAVKSLAKN